MDIQEELEDVLEKAGIEIDRSLTGEAVPLEGRGWVLYQSYARAQASAILLTVTVAVGMGKDIGKLAEDAWNAILHFQREDVEPGVATVAYLPQAVTWRYGSIPVPGRGNEPMDCADITVTTGCTLDRVA